MDECWRDTWFGPWEPLPDAAADADGALQLVPDMEAERGFASDARYLAWIDSFGSNLAVVDVERRRFRVGRLGGPIAGIEPLALADGVLAVANGNATETIARTRLLLLNLEADVWGVVERKESPPRSMTTFYNDLRFRQGRVAWHEYTDDVDAESRIRWRDLRTGETGAYQATFGTGVQKPAIDSDWLVFFEYSGPWATNDLVAVNLATQERRRITETPYEKFHLVIQGSLVVWSEDTSHLDGEGLSLGGDLWQHDLSSGETRPLVVAEELQMAPWLSGETLLWADLRNGEWRPNGPPLRAEGWYLNLARAEAPRRIGTVPHAVTMPRLVGDWFVWRDTAEDRAQVWAMPWTPPP